MDTLSEFGLGRFQLENKETQRQGMEIEAF